MANTPYIDLVKPAGTDKALISVLNANSDKIDSAVGGVQDALAIVCNGNTHGAITSGQFVYVRAHDTLQEGLYTANSNIAANATLSSSNLTANSSGGLNALNEQIAAINEQIAGSIPQNANLDSFLKQGVYRSPLTISGVATLTNCPTDIPFTLIVSSDGTLGGSVQTVLTQGHIYTRRATSTVWSNWYDFVGTIVS